mgnify:CR=1 FL=1
MKRPKIVLVVTDKEQNSKLAAYKVDLLEIRVDLFKRQDVAYCLNQIKQRRLLKIPIILTIRNQKKEGAVKEFADATKWELMQALLPFANWVDIELTSPILRDTVSLARRFNKKVVVSTHNFIKFPHNMEQILKKSMSLRADMVKFAFTPTAENDLMCLIDFTQRHRKQAITTMCVGSLGALSRLILPAAGSRWVYSFINKPTAAGQVNVRLLQQQLDLYYPSK